jgi:hypothetical protein
MNKLMFFLFLSILIIDYLSINFGLLNRYAILLPEILSAATMIIFTARFMIVGGKFFPHKYILFIILYLLNIAIGVIVNLESAGPLIAGLRGYLKFFPFFILPFVYQFSHEQISRQLKFLLALLIIQAPLALYQRLFLSRDLLTGDLVKGTLTSSGYLTVVLTCGVAILMSFYAARRISLVKFMILFLLLFIPMTINETKVTLILLPMALAAPMLLSSSSVSIKQYVPMTIIGLATGFAFIFVYDYFIQDRWGYGLLDFFTMEGRTENYLYKGAEASEDPGRVGRVDMVSLAFQTISKNILNLLFGFGIGNVSVSSIRGFSGEYAEKFRAFNVDGTALSIILWEIGLAGIILYFVFIYMIFKDSRRLTQCNDGFIKTLANGWSVVTVIVAISMAYKDIIHPNIAFLFWYFSGYVVSEYSRYKKAALKAS